MSNIWIIDDYHTKRIIITAGLGMHMMCFPLIEFMRDNDDMDDDMICTGRIMLGFDIKLYDRDATLKSIKVYKW